MPGITALVGPNGSGKSNVVDAVRWCLGEQSMRDLRGRRSDDVIHAGRKRLLGLAEVTLTFEPDAASSASVGDLAVTRRLYRSGESEYAVNGHRARLKDLGAALKEVEIDAGRHVVVNQGMADAWLSASALDRRSLIEQAAGLTTYRERRDEARQKLSQTERNIETVTTVLAELEPRVRLLRRQARAVQEREDAQRRLRYQLTLWHAHRWHTVSTRAAQLRDDASRLAADRAEMSRRLTVAEEEGELRGRRQQEWNERFTAALRSLYEVERERDMVEVNLRSTREHHLAAISAHDELGHQLDQLRSQSEAAARTLRESVDALAGVRDEKESLSAQSAAQNQALQDLERRASELSRGHTENRAQYERVDREVRRLHRQVRELDGAQEEDVRRARYAEERRNTHVSQVTETEGELQRARDDLESTGREHETHQKRFTSTRIHRETLVARRERVRSLLRRVSNDLSETSRKLKAVERELATENSHIEGTLVGAARVREGWEIAVAAALGVWAFAGTSPGGRSWLHVQDDEEFDAWRAALASAIPPGAQWADDVVSGAPRDVVNPLRCALLVETRDDARTIWTRVASHPAHRVSTPPIQVVARDGSSWSAVGVQTPPQDDPASRLLEQRARRERLRKRSGVLAHRQSHLTAAEKVIERDSTEAEGIVESMEREVEAAAVRLAAARERVRALDRRLQEHREEVDEQHARLMSLERSRRDRSLELAQVRRSLHDAQQVVQRLSPAVVEQEGALEAIDRERRDLRAGLERLLVRVEAAASTEVLLSRQHASAEQEIQRCAVQERSTVERLRELVESIADKGARIATTEEQLRGLREAVDRKQQTVESLKRQQPREDARDPSLSAMRASVASAVSAHERALAQCAQLQEDIGVLEQDIERDLEMRASALPFPEEPPATDDEIRRLRSRATQYADVDVSVVDEFHSLAERQRALEAGVSDLQGAAEHLRGIMNTADQEMRKRFDRAFSDVNDEFGRVFKIMLRGGDARLEQIDENGGVEIHAQLPGRRARASAAFSGGERALIASALLFGVLRIRPTPFCILDEVDAALDESNVDRYLHVLRDISRHTQVIVVTHNRATMTAADALYGLTMDGDGVSSAISLKLDAYNAAG